MVNLKIELKLALFRLHKQRVLIDTKRINILNELASLLTSDITARVFPRKIVNHNQLLFSALLKSTILRITISIISIIIISSL